MGPATITFAVFIVIVQLTQATDYDYLDPTKLQTKTSAKTQQETATRIITKYLPQVTVEVNPLLFVNKKDVFSLRTIQGQLNIRASSGVAAVWGFNYYLKKYCKSQIAWQVQLVRIPNPLPEVEETIVANDKLRYYQNVCTASYSFAWWNWDQWAEHIEWMALNGINLALAPIAQEAIWTRVYKKIGMTEDEINEHFTGPAFLAWLRMGNVRGWGGPLPKSWHDRQIMIQDKALDYMFKLGMVPVLPVFNGHVPKAFARIYPNSTSYAVETWNNFESDYCCGLYLDPSEPLFKSISKMYMNELIIGSPTSNIYTADPFNEVKIRPWSTALIQEAARAIFSSMSEVDENAVWLLQNWMFVHDPVLWPKNRVQAFLTSVPKGRMLIIDLQSEQWPQYDLYEMYYGHAFIWSMLHNFGGTLGMFGNTQTINKDVYETRVRPNSTMIGIGLTPEGINQNYVVYDLMLESAWRKEPIQNLEKWVEDYAERRYGCNNTNAGWRYLFKSVYNFTGLNRMRGKYVITRRPSFKIRPWAWYRSHDLFEAFKNFAFKGYNCYSPTFNHDLVDVTRQALQYRAEQLYLNLKDTRYSNSWVFNASIIQFLDIMNDMEQILASNRDFTAINWLANARGLSKDSQEAYLYEMNARNQITLWGPNGEITDYACKQWAELFHFYYTPRWSTFLDAALTAKMRGEFFDEKGTQDVIKATVEDQFISVAIAPLPEFNTRDLALALYKKWGTVAGLRDLPMNVIRHDPDKSTTLADTDVDNQDASETPSVVLLSTTPYR